MPLLKKEAPAGKKYTEEDYLSWPDAECWELIEGVAYAKEGGIQAMAPAPSRRHQEVQLELIRIIANFLKGKPCKVYMAPFDVRLTTHQKKDTVVQPDVAVICDQNKLDDKGCVGSPDLIMEVVSPASAQIDYVRKLGLYEKHGVQEYWIIHPFEETVMIFKLVENGQYGRPDVYTSEDKVPVGIFQGELVIDLKDVFSE